MTEERMRILKMLEEGKINADEAAKLLSAVETSAMAMPATARVFSDVSGRASRSRRIGQVRIASRTAVSLKSRNVSPSGIVKAKRLGPAMRIRDEGRGGAGSSAVILLFSG